MIDISAALNDAYKRTKYLLWERRSFGRWWRFGLLGMLTGGGGGGGGFNFRLPAQLLQASKKDTAMLGLMVATGAVGDFDTNMLPLIIGFGVGIFVFALFFAWLSNCAQFVLVESIVYDRHVLAEPFGRLKSNGTGLFLWTFLVGLACMIPAGAIVAGGVGIGVMAQDSPGTMVAVGLAALAVLAVLGLGICVLFALTTQFVVPVAYRQRIGINSAWSLVWQTLRQRKGDTCLFLLVLMGVAMAGAFGVMMGVMLFTGLAAVVSGIVLGMPAFFLYQQQMTVPAVVCGVLFALIVLGSLFFSSLVFQTPLTVLTRCFGMYIMQQLMPEFGLLPLGGITERASSEEEPILSPEPQPLGALADDSWQRPEF